jgi:hypothetical protein
VVNFARLWCAENVSRAAASRQKNVHTALVKKGEKQLVMRLIRSQFTTNIVSCLLARHSTHLLSHMTHILTSPSTWDGKHTLENML